MKLHNRIGGWVVGLAMTIMADAAQVDVTFEWARALGGAGATVAGRSIALDAAGNVYTVGEFAGTADFDPGPGVVNLTAAGEVDCFVSKLDVNGNLQWARAVGGAGAVVGGQGVAVDATGNVYTTGSFRGTVDFDPSPGVLNLTAAGELDIFVSKLDANGNLQWAYALGSSGSDEGTGIAVDAAGNVHITGYFRGTVDLDPGPGVHSLVETGFSGAFVSKLDADGDLVWARAIEGPDSSAIALAVALDAAGNVHTTGNFSGSVDFDPGPGVFNLAPAGGAFVSKLDANGDFLWAQHAVTGAFLVFDARGIAVDAAGNVYTTGDVSPYIPNWDIYASKLNANGDPLWQRVLDGSSNIDRGFDIAVDAEGSAYITGMFFNFLDFDPGPGVFNLIATGDDDIFVWKLDTNGELLWAHAMGGSIDDAGHGIAVDSAGNVHTTGVFRRAADFDPGPDEFIIDTGGLIRQSFVVKWAGPPDLIPPNAIAVVPTNTGPTNAVSVAFNVGFDEPVQNFDDASDLVLGHAGTASAGVLVTGGPELYTVIVEGISGNGSLTLAVATNSDVQDLAGNALADSVTSAAVLIDNTPPVFTGLTATPALAVLDEEVAIGFTASEPLLWEPEVTVNTRPATRVAKNLYSYTYTVTGDDPVGPAEISVLGVDLAGNAGVLSDPNALTIGEPPATLPLPAWPAALALLALGGTLALRGRR